MCALSHPVNVLRSMRAACIYGRMFGLVFKYPLYDTHQNTHMPSWSVCLKIMVLGVMQLFAHTEPVLKVTEGSIMAHL